MSAPPLPDAFGNYALGDFVEVVSPQAINWLPQTTGWWWLGAVLALLLLRSLWQRLRVWYHNRYRREAQRRLQQLSPDATGPDLALKVNKLLKLTAMAAYSRERVASLSGQEWVDFLQQQTAAPVFSEQQCGTLAAGMYRAQPLDNANGQNLIKASLEWVRDHREVQHD